MENRGILVDTTILIDFLRKKNKEKTLLWKLKEMYTTISISSISVFELFAGAIDNSKVKNVQSLLKWLEVVEFDEELGEMAGRIFILLKMRNKIIDFRDLFIGTTAVFYNLEIATLNINHFVNIPNIKIFNTSTVV
ncbi:type II toxin-antitoxin system VapC family toxin [candidate division KSB1 bacterium]|nr:type II toxin-antitoxin system VapC family toxin [candidate division KSB1 bacterium]